MLNCAGSRYVVLHRSHSLVQYHCTAPLCAEQESKSGPVTLHYSSFAEALAVGPDQLGINIHPMYHVMQGEAAAEGGCNASPARPYFVAHPLLS